MPKIEWDGKLNLTAIIAVLVLLGSWIFYAVDFVGDAKDAKIAVIDAKKEIKKLQNGQAQQSVDIGAVRTTLEHITTVVTRIEQRQYDSNSRRSEGTISPSSPVAR